MMGSVEDMRWSDGLKKVGHLAWRLMQVRPATCRVVSNGLLALETRQAHDLAINVEGDTGKPRRVIKLGYNTSTASVSKLK